MDLVRVYLRALNLLAPEKWLASLLVVANLAIAGVYFLQPWLLGRIVDALASPTKSAAWPLIGIWAALGLVSIAVSTWVALNADKLAHRRQVAAIEKVVENELERPFSFHRGRHSARLQRVIHLGASSLIALWLGVLRDHLVTILSTFIILPLALVINWRLGLLMSILLIVFPTCNAIAMRMTRKSQEQVEKLNHETYERIADATGNAAVIQSFTCATEEISTIRAMMKRALLAQYPVLRNWAVLSSFSHMVSTLTMVAIFGLGAYLSINGKTSVGIIVTFTGFATTLIGRLQRLVGFTTGLFFQQRSLNDFFELMDSSVAEDTNRATFPCHHSVRGSILFENVSFWYQDASPIISEVNFEVTPGSTVAIVGPTGAGKTTLLSLLYRAYDPTEGRITVGGVDIREMELKCLRRNIAVVFQETGLFNRSIIANLRIGNSGATLDEIENIVSQARADRFIRSKPEGYNTKIGERGSLLSVGERQRLAIARAMLKNAPIIILDEAMSAVDNETEFNIREALRKHNRDCTTFIISHRVANLTHVDKILVIEDGRIVEQGSFRKLISRNGLFARLAAVNKY